MIGLLSSLGISLPNRGRIDSYLAVTLGATVPTLGTYMFSSVSATKTVTVKVPSGATGYGSSPTDTTTDNWGNGFRGKGWDGSNYGSGTVNSNISLTIKTQ
jgi:hypothetical protein